MKKQFWKEKDGQYLLETEAFNLAFNYYKEFNKYSKKHVNVSNIKRSKFWPAFIKTIELRGSQDEWNNNLFIKILFDEYGKFYPFKLYTDEAWNTYVDYYKRGFENRDKTIALSLLNSYKVIQNWCKKKKIDFSIERYFADPLVRLLMENKKLSPYFLSICKPFKDYYFKLDIVDQFKIIKPSELESARRAVFQNTKIVKKMKTVLKDNFDGGSI